MRDVDLAYLAGVLDSDGYITVHRSRRSSGAVYFTPKVGIAGTERAPHDFARALFGGSVWSYEPKNPAHRVQFMWEASGRMAAVILRGVLPYLLVKRRQAELGLDLQALIEAQFAELRATTRPPYRIPPDMVAEREALCDAVRALNHPRSRARQEVPS